MSYLSWYYINMALSAFPIKLHVEKFTNNLLRLTVGFKMGYIFGRHSLISDRVCAMHILISRHAYIL